MKDKSLLLMLVATFCAIFYAKAESYTVAPGGMTYHKGTVIAGKGVVENATNIYSIQIPDDQYATVALIGGRFQSLYCQSIFTANINGYGKIKLGGTAELTSSTTLNVGIQAFADTQMIPYGQSVQSKIGLATVTTYLPTFKKYEWYIAQQEYELDVTYAKKMPDIYVGSVSLSESAVAVDESAVISFTVGNGGWIGTGTESVVRIYDGTNQLGDDLSVPALGRHAKVQKSVALPNLTAGTHNIRIVADATGKVNEASESNNNVEMSLRVYNRMPVGVTYDLNGGGSPLFVSIVAGNLVGKLPTVDRPGYDFKGWWSAATGGTQIGSDEKITESRTFYAHWSARKTQIALNRQCGGQGTRTVVATYDQPMSNIEIPVRKGYVFGGYWSEPDGEGTQYYSSVGTGAHLWDMDASQLSLYAKWTGCEVALSLDRCGGAGGSTAIFAEYSLPFPSVLPPSWSGWTFQGYFTEPNGGGLQCYDSVGNAVAICSFTDATVLYAYWLPIQMDYFLSLDQQGGYGMDSVTATYGRSMPSVVPPERDQYVFRGYFSGPNGMGKKYYNDNGTAAALWDSVSLGKLYACWEKAYHVVLSGNGTGEASQIQYFTTDRWELKDVPYYRNGYVLAGWSLHPDGPPMFPSGAVVNKDTLGYGDDPDAAEATLYAIWGKELASPLTIGSSMVFFTGGKASDSGWIVQDGALRSVGSDSWLAASFEGHGDLSIICANAFFSSATMDFTFFSAGHLYTNSYTEGFVRDVSASDGCHLVAWRFRKDIENSGWNINWGNHACPENDTELQLIISEKESHVTELMEKVYEAAKTVLIYKGASYSADKLRDAVSAAFADCRANEAIGYLEYHIANILAEIGTGNGDEMLRAALKKYPGTIIPGIVDYVDGCAEASSVLHDLVGIDEFMASYATLKKALWRPTCQVGFLEDPIPDLDSVLGANREIQRIHLAYEDLKGPIAEIATRLLTPSGYSITDQTRAACREMIKNCLDDCWTSANGGFVNSALNSRISSSTLDLRKSNYYGAVGGNTSNAENLRLGRELNRMIGNASALLTDRDLLLDYMRDCGMLEIKRLVAGSSLGTLPVSNGRDGFTFAGWYTADGKGPFGTQTTITDDTMLFARWETNLYSIVFQSNGGTAVSSQTKLHGDALCNLPVSSRDGFAFEGWYTDSSGTVAIDPYAPIVASRTLYAQWTPKRSVDHASETLMFKSGSSFLWNDSGNSDLSLANDGWYQVSFGVLPEEVHELYLSVDGVAPAVAASEYNGYLYDANGNVKGTIQVKVGKPGKDGKASVKATVVVGTSKVALTAADSGKAEIAEDGPTTIQLVGGEACTVVLGAEGLSGSYGAHTIDGARNFFSSKDKSEQGAANDLLAKWQGAVNVVWDGGNASVSIAKKGKVKVAVTFADGTKATANAQLLVGEKLLCVPVVVTKKANLAFALWLPLGEGRAIVDGLGDGALAGKPGSLGAGAKFRLDAAEFAAAFGQAVLSYLPDGIAVTQSGTKWTLPKAGKIAYKDGAVDETKLGDNPSGLKLAYKAKDGSFKGSFKVYAVDGAKVKATTVNVTGVMVNGVGYGTATIKGRGVAPVTIE